MSGFRSALPIPLGVGKPGVALGFIGLPWFRGGTVETAVPDTSQPAAGWSGWLNNVPRPRRVEDEEDERQEQPKPKKKVRRYVADGGHVILEGDVTVQTGVIEATPAWDALSKLQRDYEEAERIRRKKLRAIALADDDWLMML